MDLRFGKYVLREETRELLLEGEAVRTTSKSLAVLQVLVQARGAVVSKQDLLKAVWSDSFVDEGSVSQNIFVLRKLLAPSFPAQPPIETVGRLGYRFRIPVEELVEAPPVAPEPAASAEAAPATVPFPALLSSNLARSRMLLTLAAVLLVILATCSTVWLVRTRGEASTRPSGTIAVLSLRNLTGDPHNAWLSVALREMLSTDLTAGTRLKLLPEETVKRAQNELGLKDADGLSPETLRKLQDDLDCDQVISGSYAVSGGRLHMGRHLMNAHTGAQLASYSIDRPEAELRALVAEDSRSLRAQLGVPPPSLGDQQAMEAALPTSVDAYHLYVDGLEAGRNYDSLRARELLTKSLAIDPNFALAHAALGSAYQMAGLQTKANEEVDRAIALSHNLSQVDRLNVLVNAQSVRHQYQAAADTYRTLMGVAPDDLGYGILYAQALNNAGHSHEALAELDRLMARPGPESTDPRLYSTAADAWGVLGDWPRSLEWAERAAAESKRRGARISYGRLLTSVSQARLYLKQYDRATAETNESLQIAREFKDYSAELRALNRLAQIDLAQNKLDDAEHILTEALNRETALGEQQRQIHTLETLGKVMTNKGNHAAALQYYDRAVAAAASFGQAQFLVSARYYKALGAKNTGDVKGATRQLEAVLQDASRIDDKQTQLDALGTMAEIHAAQGKHRAALEKIHTALGLADADQSHAAKFKLLDLQTRSLLSEGLVTAANTSLNQEAAVVAGLQNSESSSQFLATQAMVRETQASALR